MDALGIFVFSFIVLLQCSQWREGFRASWNLDPHGTGWLVWHIGSSIYEGQRDSEKLYCTEVLFIPTLIDDENRSIKKSQMPLRRRLSRVVFVYIYSGRVFSPWTYLYAYTYLRLTYMFCNAPSPRAGWLDCWTCSGDGSAAERGRDDGNILSFAYVWGLRRPQQSGCALNADYGKWLSSLYTNTHTRHIYTYSHT